MIRNPRYSPGIRAANPGHWIDAKWVLRLRGVSIQVGDPDRARTLYALADAIEAHLLGGGFR